MKIFRLIVIVFAIIAGFILYIHQDFKDCRDAGQFYAEKGDFLNQPTLVSLPEFLEDLSLNPAQIALINQFKNARYEQGKLAADLAKNFDFAGLIHDNAISEILANKASGPIQLRVEPQKFLQDSLAASQKGRRFSQILALKALVEADMQQPEKAVRLFEAALTVLPEAYRHSEGMFFGAFTRIQTLLDASFLCRAINQACYLADFNEYQVSILLERLKNLDQRFPPIKDVLLQYRALPANFTLFFTSANIERDKDRHKKFQQVLTGMVPHAEAFFDQHYARFAAIGTVDLASGEKLCTEFAGEQEILKQKFKDRFSFANIFRNPFAYRRHFAEQLACAEAPPFQLIHSALWKCKQQLEGTRTMLAFEAYQARNKKLPDSLLQLNDFFNQTFGKDLFNGSELQYASEPLKLSSAGPDKTHGSSDDVRIFPETEILSN